MFETTLKQLDAIFPQFNIKPPIKKALVRSLIQEIQIPSFSPNNFNLLKNSQTAKKALEKLNAIFNAWLKIIQSNEKARQQHLSKYISYKAIQKLEYVYAECSQVQSKSDFIVFIRTNGREIFQELGLGPNVSQYKQILIYNSLDSYNTITTINQDQYFQQLQELTEKLSILERMTKAAMKKIDNLEDFYELIKNEELFKKKDNSLNRVINYNIVKTLELSKSLEKNKKTLYRLQENLVFSVARCYYLCFMSQEDIEKSKNDEKKLKQIKSFLCQREEKVFPKLYHRKINKSLIMMDKIQKQFINRKYEEQNILQKQRKVQAIDDGLSYIQNRLKTIIGPIQEKQFVLLYGELSNLLTDSTSLKDQKGKKMREELEKLQKHLVTSFSNQSKEKRRFLRSQVKNTVQNQINAGKQQSEDEPQQIVPDLAQDIFPPIPVLNEEEEKVKNALKKLSENPNIYENECKNYVKIMKEEYGSELNDFQNFQPEKIQILLNVAEKTNNKAPYVLLLDQLLKSWIKPEIKVNLLSKMFNPSIRNQAFTIFIDKLVEHSYKITKSINSPQFNEFPVNLKNYLIKREVFVKYLLKKIERLQELINTLCKIHVKQKYNVVSAKTYGNFLKMILIAKEISAFQKQIIDEKVSPQLKRFINDQIYKAVLDGLQKKTFQIFRQPVFLPEILDELDFYRDFIQETERIIDKSIQSLQNQRQMKDLIIADASRMLEKWTQTTKEKLQKKRHVFSYEKVQKQIEKVDQMIEVCREGRKGKNITDSKAKRFLRLIS